MVDAAFFPARVQLGLTLPRPGARYALGVFTLHFFVLWCALRQWDHVFAPNAEFLLARETPFLKAFGRLWPPLLWL